MKKVLILLLCFFFGGIFSFRDAVAQSANNNPFIYYYLKEENAFVIERADGSDRRILANFKMSSQAANEEVQNIIVGPGWSPSGKWFAWRETTNYGGIGPAYVANQESVTVELLKGADIAEMHWSPIDDFLMVMTTANNSQPFAYDMYLIDMDNLNNPIQIRDVKEDTLSLYDFADWTSDGHHITQYFTQADGKSRMEFISTDGKSEFREFFRPQITCSYPAWSDNSKVAYIDETGQRLILESTIDRQLHKINIPRGVLRRIVWSPDSNQLVFYTSDNCSKITSKVSLWLATLDNDNASLISEDVQLPFNPSVPYQFLILPTWADNSHYVFFMSEGNLFVYDVTTLTQIHVPSGANGNPSNISWLADSKLVFTLTGQTSTNIESSINIFDPSKQTTTAISVNSSLPITKLTFSKGEESLAYVDQEIHVLDTLAQTDTELQLPNSNNSNSPYSENIQQIIWSQLGDWIIVLTGDKSGKVYVVNTKGNKARELTTCSSERSCFGWLPM